MTTGAFPDRLSKVAARKIRNVQAKRRVYIAALSGASNRVPVAAETAVNTVV